MSSGIWFESKLWYTKNVWSNIACTVDFFFSSETQNNYDKECPVSLNNYTVVYMLFFSILLILKLGHNYKYSPLHKFWEWIWLTKV